MCPSINTLYLTLNNLFSLDVVTDGKMNIEKGKILYVSIVCVHCILLNL